MAIQNALYHAAARALAHGHFTPTTGTSDRPVDTMFFQTGDSSTGQGGKKADTTSGVDITGATGSAAYAEFTAYIIAASSITVSNVHLDYGARGVDFSNYATTAVNRSLVTDQKYTVTYRITFQAAA